VLWLWVVGGDTQAALRIGGLTNSAGTTVHLLLTSGDEPSCMDTRRWRYSPRWLRVNDNDDEGRQNTKGK